MTAVIACVVLLALACGNGVHLAALQSLAWATMLLKATQSKSIATAVTETFDGRHPCPLCKVVEESSTSREDEPPKMISGFELRAIPAPQVRAPAPDSAPFFHASTVSDAERLAAEPPTPPPRAA